ncbi:MAG: hypothetical protein DRO93_13600 [Candidatus Thorarchaeota archaeon]|nr:MAG: hypothetical protein DRO93_13600 [Candidatus Thorarchaeota archaeon]
MSQSGNGDGFITIGYLEIRAPPVLIDTLVGEDTSASVVEHLGEGPYAIGISLSRPTREDLEMAGYNVIAEIGTPQEMSPAHMTAIAENVAVVVDRIVRVLRSQPLYLALACPVTVAFLIGSLVGPLKTVRILHWEGGYKVLPKHDTDRVRKKVSTPGTLKI